MKTNKKLKYYGGFIILTILFACNEGIDPINAVDPGPDLAAPAVTITYPQQGTEVRVKEDVAPINIQFEVSDDIEIEQIAVALDGTEIAMFDNFKDYRRAIQSYTYESLMNGDHNVTVTAIDISGKSTSASVGFVKIEPYVPVFEGEIFYMPFDGDVMELVSITNATKVGSPTFSDESVAGKSYAGAEGAYLTMPTAGLLGDEFSAAFWYNVNASPDRSGILTAGPPDPLMPAAPNNRKNGFRLFREGSASNQTFILILGTGETDVWFNGGATASINPTTTDWVHLAFTISDSQAVVYINGEIVSQGAFPGIDWTGCDILSIASGAPRFMEWGHLSDASLYDELRLFNKALTQEEIQAIMEY